MVFTVKLKYFQLMQESNSKHRNVRSSKAHKGSNRGDANMHISKLTFYCHFSKVPNPRIKG